MSAATRTITSRPARPTRSSASRSPTRRPRWSASRASERLRPARPAPAHRLPAARARRRSARAIEAVAGLGHVRGHQPRRRPRRRLHARRRPAVDPGVRRRARSARPRASWTRRARSSTSPAARSSRNRRHALHGESVKRNVSTWVAVDGGMSDNLRPMLYGARYEAQLADRVGGGDPVPRRRQALRVLRRDRPRRRARRPAPGDIVVTPVTGAYGYAMANNYNGVPAAARRVRARRRRARGRAPRDLRRPALP